MIWRKDGKRQEWHRRFRGLPWLAVASATGASSPSPTYAQDGAFDMGALTSTLSTDHVTQAERARSIDDQIFNSPARQSRRQELNSPIATMTATMSQ